VNPRERSWLAWTGLAILLASNLPYLVAWIAAPANAHFTSFLFNPVDGHSYLAKMRQGFEGSWRFHLAFTPERSSGAHIFLFHLWLGHLARWTKLPLIAVYHGSRILGGAAMLVAIYALASRLSARRRERGTMFLLTALGSGLGWLLLTTGVRTADLWVPEAFPAYSMMVNAHFPLALGLMAATAYCGLRVLAAGAGKDGRGGKIWPLGLAMALTAVLLGAIQPFGLVPVFGGLGIALTASTASAHRRVGSPVPWRAGAWIAGAAATALPYPLYMQAAIRSDPVLAAWNAQNVTASPPLWDWVLSYGLLSILAAWGGGAAIRRGSNGDVMVVGWALVTLVGMYLPLPLQRRFSIGLGIPMGLLAGMGWAPRRTRPSTWVPRRLRPRNRLSTRWSGIRELIHVRRRGLARGLIIAFSALTPILLIVMTSSAALRSEASPDSWLYLSDGEWAALRWLRRRAETQQEAVVLCAPQMGSFVPAWTGHRVVYGHPFETVNASRREEKVKAYWTGAMSASDQAAFLEENQVQYILVGPREQALNPKGWDDVEAGDLVFDTYDTRIYAINGQ
jgi:hypothetical protein